VYSRVLISQDRHQIFLTIAEYPLKYIDYLRNKKGVNIDDKDFALLMKMFGYFDTRVAAHMELLGVLVKVILSHAANAIRTTTMGDLGQEFIQMNISKGKERAQDDPQAETSMWGKSRTGGGRTPSQSPSRSSTPTPGGLERGRNSPVADSRVRRRDGSQAPPSALSGIAPSNYGNDGMGPMTPRQADRRPYSNSRASPANRPSSGGNNMPTARDARPIPVHPDPAQRVGSSHRSSSASSNESESTSRRSRSPLTGPERAMERAAVPRSMSSSPLRHGQPVRPSANHGSPADRGQGLRRPPLYPTSERHSDSPSSGHHG
jgi:hypothetical protein